ncbi:hypothetical protein BDV32DRAFT_128816 [Aspergillus pseudonomiae]|nr:hypothetical protein BDV32DRAFT_128816 [Aspergillus pseudonomiae]
MLFYREFWDSLCRYTGPYPPTVSALFIRAVGPSESAMNPLRVSPWRLCWSDSPCYPMSAERHPR